MVSLSVTMKSLKTIFPKLAALAEVLLVLAAGNLIGELAFSLIMPASVLERTASDPLLAAADGLLILFRLGTAGALGLLLLYWRTGMTARRTGVSTAGKPVLNLVGQGLLMGLVSGGLVAGLFALQELVGLGEGLSAWRTYSYQSLDLAFFISVLGTSVLIPPLTEEIMTRAYMRSRIVEAFGPMAGVLITALVFSLSHTRYISADGMLAGFLLILIVNSCIWTYSAQRTGSILPAFVAHAVSNGVGTLVLFNVWWPLMVIVIGLIPWLGELGSSIRGFRSDWREDIRKGSLWGGLLIIFVILLLAMTGLSLFGRTITLAVIGAASFLLTALLFATQKVNRGS